VFKGFGIGLRRVVVCEREIQEERGQIKYTQIHKVSMTVKEESGDQRWRVKNMRRHRGRNKLRLKLD
jgi:hypothetical protein